MTQPEPLRRGMEQAHRNRREANRANQEVVRTVIKEMIQHGEVLTDREILRRAGLSQTWFQTKVNWAVRDEARAAREHLRENFAREALARKSSLEHTLVAENVELLARIQQLGADLADCRAALKQARVDALEGFDPTPLREAIDQQQVVIAELQASQRHLEIQLETAKLDRRRDQAVYEDMLRELRERIPDA
jgi:hypothetical protein